MSEDIDKIKIGEYIIRRHDENSVWIEINGEGGQFQDILFIECIRKFYAEQF